MSDKQMYKTELHCHTSPISNCAHVSAEETAEHFIEYGYTTLVITNHLSPSFYKHLVPDGMTDADELCELYLSDYRRAKAQAGNRMNVILGMELRVKENMNDYLIYGIDEEFVRDMIAADVMDMKTKQISEFVHERGALIFQAHPFRNNMTVTDPKLLDGIEVTNFTASHNSRNEIAKIWARFHRLREIVGTDYHNKSYIRGAGILTEQPITTSTELINVLENQNFKVTDGTVTRDVSI